MKRGHCRVSLIVVFIYAFFCSPGRFVSLVRCAILTGAGAAPRPTPLTTTPNGGFSAAPDGIEIRSPEGISPQLRAYFISHCCWLFVHPGSSPAPGLAVAVLYRREFARAAPSARTRPP